MTIISKTIHRQFLLDVLQRLPHVEEDGKCTLLSSLSELENIQEQYEYYLFQIRELVAKYQVRKTVLRKELKKQLRDKDPIYGYGKRLK